MSDGTEMLGPPAERVVGVIGVHRKPMVDLLDKLAQALNVPFHELFLPPEPGAEPPKALPSGRPRGKT
jgi:hypothetical protein